MPHVVRLPPCSGEGGAAGGEETGSISGDDGGGGGDDGGDGASAERARNGRYSGERGMSFGSPAAPIASL